MREWVSERRWLAAVAGMAAALLLYPMTTASATHTAFSNALVIPPEIVVGLGGTVELVADEASVPILAGQTTDMWTFNGTFPGPTIRQQASATGPAPITVKVTNQLDTAGAITVHNHGNHSEPRYDGRPHDFLIAPGSDYSYVYEAWEDGATERGTLQWYHDHHHGFTGRNVWFGLAGMYIIEDPNDPQTLPAGTYEVPLMLTDRTFLTVNGRANQLTYALTQNGRLGDHVLVNGLPQPFFNVEPTRYRFRILNASNSRIYNLELSNGALLTQIGTESGLLAAPISRTPVIIGPAERTEVVIDFTGLNGQNIQLRNGRNNTDLLQFRVGSTVTGPTGSVPATLRNDWPDLTTQPIAANRTFVFDENSEGDWAINDLAWDHDRYDARPVLGTTEKWTLVNPSAVDTHVVHIHDVDQQLLTRNGDPPEPYEAHKESWLLGPGQTVEVLLRFTDHTGPYVFHCHILEHEDGGMMSQFEVVEAPPATSTTTTTTLPGTTTTTLPGGTTTTVPTGSDPPQSQSQPGSVFVDDDGSVFEADIERLAAAGITKGCNPPVNDRFCPNDPVTRGQMAAFLVRGGLADG